MHRTILIVDSDKRWLSAVSRLFSASGYKTCAAEHCDEALKSAERYPPDCVLLDHRLADADIYRFYPALRSRPCFKYARIVITVGRGRENETASRLTLADAFLVKEGSLFRIRAVIANVLRRAKWEKATLHKGDLELCAVNSTVKRRFGPARQISPGQFRFLSLLVEKSPECVPEDAVAMRVFGKSSITGRRGALRALVYRLRFRLGPGLARRIKNVKRHGWMYMAGRVRPGVPKRLAVV